MMDTRQRLEQIDAELDELWSWLGGQDPGVIRWPEGTEQEYQRLCAERDAVLAEMTVKRENSS